MNGFNICMQASDSGTPPMNSTLIVTVTLTDVNDNAPEFDKTSMDFALETTAVFDLVSTVGSVWG